MATGSSSPLTRHTMAWRESLSHQRTSERERQPTSMASRTVPPERGALRFAFHCVHRPMELTELVEQERVEALLQVPRVLLVDDDPAHDEHGTASVRSGLVNEAQVQIPPIAFVPRRSGARSASQQRSRARGTAYFGPLR